MIGLSYVFYGWVGWSYCLLLLATTVGGLRRRGLGQRHEQRADPAHRHGGVGRRAAGHPRLVQVLRLRLGQPRQPHPRRGVGPGRPAPAGGLPIAISFFTFMAISYVVDIYRRELEPAKPLDFAVYISFFPHLLAGPIVRGTELLPQIRRRRDPDSVDYSRAFWLILAGPVQEGRDLVLRVERDRHACLHLAHPALGARGDLRRLGLRGADLLRLQRLHRHRHRAGHAAGLPVPAELRRALHGAQPAGLLASLAHDAVALAARLPLHPARRECQRPGPDGPQHHDHHGAGRALARRGVDVRGLGGAAGRRAELRAPAPDQPGAARAAGRGRRAGAGVGAALPDLPVRLPGVGLLQCDGHVAGLRRHRPGVQRLG